MKNSELSPDFVVYGELPPNFEAVVEKIPRAAEKGVIFAYSPAVYVPSGRPLPPHLVEHEKVHLEQQGANPAAWWQRYLDDLDFRFEQELEAHVAEYEEYCRHHRDRNVRSHYLAAISRRLAGSLYGCQVTTTEARQMLKEAAR